MRVRGGIWDDYSPPYYGFKKGPNDTYQYTSESFALAGVKTLLGLLAESHFESGSGACEVVGVLLDLLHR